MSSEFEWPVTPGPPESLMKRLREGYVLTAEEHDRLNEAGAQAAQLEYRDPNFARASRKWRAEHQEEQRLESMRKEQKAKKEAEKQAQARRDREAQARREEREAREEKGRQQRGAHFREMEEKRQHALEQMALTDRRSMVRETIRDALVSQSRLDATASAGRSMFNGRTSLDNPGPGTYDPKLPPVRAASFEKHHTAESRASKGEEPGPGSYDPKLPPTVRWSFGGPRPPPSQSASPGPAAYSPKLAERPGGVISKHTVKSDTDRAIDVARAVPGPGTYDPERSEKGSQLISKSASLYGRTAQAADHALRHSSHAPGPGAYDLPPARIRGGAMGADKRDGAFAASKNPGPGEYFRTPTIGQERELRRLSKRVVGLVTERQRNMLLGVSDAPVVAPPPPIRAQSKLQHSTSYATFLTDRASAGDGAVAASEAKAAAKPPRLGFQASCSMPRLA